MMISLANEEYEAVFDPENGMTLLSLKKNGLEVIDQTASSKKGPLIGPHFHIHTQYVPPNGESYHHGVARYASWRYVHSQTQIKGHLSSKDSLDGYPLSLLEGQNFEMTFEARLIPTGLRIKQEIQSEHPSMVGLHYYFKKGSKGVIHAEVEENYNDQGTLHPIPENWMKGKQLFYNLNAQTDFGFIPVDSSHEHKVMYETDEYSMLIHYQTANPLEVQFQLYSPLGASFVCIEPMSAAEPRQPNLTHSILETKFEIL
ncbi:MAG: hypothetical protein KBC64_00805 [Simkaniaceae bacterium]|nr:hypothetical protein [Simkaniaceae bacterium]